MKRLFAILTAALICMLSFAAAADGNGNTGAPSGTTLTFGHYPQTAEGTDQTPIEWLALDVRDGKALLISRYSLDVVPYNTERMLVTWDACSLRTWLNGEFLQAAFTEEEQALILLSKIPNGEDQNYRTLFGTSGQDTEDRVFLLSYAEVKKYLGVSTSGESDAAWPRTAPTAYALSKDARLDRNTQTAEGEASGPWWLRSPGRISNLASIVQGSGKVADEDVNNTRISVRPAFWLNLVPGADRTEYDRAEKVREFSTVGNVVRYGHYEEDNDIGNGPEEIEWIVLDAWDNKALLISKYGLDSQPYEKDGSETTWKDCSLRKWLEEEFLPAAFSEEEQAAIMLTDVDNSGGQGDEGSGASGGENTKDRMFLLSRAEADKYLVTIWINTYNTKAGVIPTAYAEEAGAERSNMLYIEQGILKIFPGWWWLRSPGKSQNLASIVYASGSIMDMSVDSEGVCVRPAFWLDLDAAPF